MTTTTLRATANQHRRHAMSDTHEEKPCKRCEQTTLLSVLGRDHELTRARHLACRCDDDCGAAHCDASDVRVA